jgi:hypothetical protein
LMMPGAGIEPIRANDLSLESSLHIRMSPSHEPVLKGSSTIRRKRRDCNDTHRKRSNLNNADWRGLSPIGASGFALQSPNRHH